MKKKHIMAIFFVILMLTGCAKGNDTVEEDLDAMEYLEGYEGLSEEEANEKLIEEANEMDVVSDKAE